MIKTLLLGSFLALGAIVETQDTFSFGRFSCQRPADAAVDERLHDGGLSVGYVLPGDIQLFVHYYRWGGGGLRHGYPKDAEAYAYENAKAGMPDGRLVAPPARTEFQGLPAWRVVTGWTVHERGTGDWKKEMRDEQLAVQRRWGYIVVQYIHAADKFEQGRPVFERFKESIVLLPEPPGAPWMLIPAALLVLAALGFGLYRLVKSRRERARQEA